MNPYALSSGQKSTSELIADNPCNLSHVSVQTNGSNAGTITVYDNTSAAGKIVWTQKVEGSENIGGRNWQFPVKCYNGIYVTISGTNAKYIIEYVQDVG